MTYNDDWVEFMNQIHVRLNKGEQLYGEKMFCMPVSELRREIEEEVLDICAWSFGLWMRIKRLGL